MNKQLIEAMAKKTAVAIGAFTGMPDWSELKFQEDKDCLIEIAEAALKAINDAGFVVVPKEPTEAMIEASGCECGMGAPEGYGDPNELYITNDYKAMVHAAQEEPEE